MPAKNRVNFATYPQDYYTGAQVRIYFGSIWVDDIATIQYQTSHSKTPLYGYGDHQFRTVAKGQFLVRGSFTIAFKESGYLYSIMQLWKKDKSGLDRLKKFIPNLPTGGEAFLANIGNGFTIENAMDQMSRTADFEDAAEVLENAIWGKEGTKEEFKLRIPRSDELDYFKHINSASDSSDIDVDGFDIMLTFGNYKSGNDSPEHTIIALNDVHITGEAMVMSPSAEPIGLTCEFFARGLNERVSNSWGESDVSIKNDIRKTNKEDEKNKQIKDLLRKNDELQNQIDNMPIPIPTANPTAEEKTQSIALEPPIPTIDVSQTEVLIPPSQSQTLPAFVKDQSIRITLKGDLNATFLAGVQRAKIGDSILGYKVTADIHGDPFKGTISGTTNNWIGQTTPGAIQGKYITVGKIIQIDITKRPGWMPWGTIDSKVREFFNN